MSGQAFKVWFHGPLLAQPTKVSVLSLRWDIDDLKEALIAKAPVLSWIGASSLMVSRAAPADVSGLFAPTGDVLSADTVLSSLGDSESMSHALLCCSSHPNQCTSAG